ncbi:C1 family peptidase [Sandarakinorhabdus sp.]|uniref:C1 family peptidase n=1 Tax=Sandarakinorhabdus sp. TaxID=1916663 RepID=UPI003341213F
MARPTISVIRQEISTRRLRWEARELPADFKPRGLGYEPSDPEANQAALANAQRLMLTRMPTIFAADSMRSPLTLQPGLMSGPQSGLGQSQQALSAPGSNRPRKFDWRDRGVVGPVTDQMSCGSCVSFAAAGMISVMAAIEQAVTPPDLSEADSHFNSSHGPSCGGWNNNTCLNQARTRGIAAETDLAYTAAFDSPPVLDPARTDGLWLPRVRAIADRNRKVYKITEVTAWTGDARKTYLANVGPLICGFTVFEDFDAYNGGVYSHATGAVRGGHAVMVVGYDDDAGCWICRNSWGTGFGGPARADGTGAGYFKIAYGDSNISAQAFYGCQGVIPPASSKWRGWWPVAGGVAAPNVSVFGVSRSRDHLDITVPGTDHGTYTAAWEPAFTDGWHGFWRIQGGVVAPATSITMVTRSANRLDAFCVGTDNGTYTAGWAPGQPKWGGWWRVQGGVAAPGTTVHGVSRSADKLDIFCVGSDRGTYTAAWQPGDTSWRGWWRVRGGVAAPGTSVTAVSRRPDFLDIFCVGSDQRVYTAAWKPGDANWRGWWPVAGGVAAPRTSVFGVSRGLDKLDIFCIGTDMQVYTAAWAAGDTNWRGWWPVGHFKAAPGTSVFAVSRSADRLDIFAVGQDGGIYSAAWAPGMQKWRGWWRILEGAAAPMTMVTAAVRAPDFLDIFAVGTDHRVYTAAWRP